MALLFPFESSNESVFPPSLRARLREFSLLQEVGEPALRRLLAEADWFGLPGGTQLPRDGENDRAVFLVVTGSLGVFIDEERGPRRLVATIPVGETVGEMSLLSAESHSATIVALRDTELLRLGPKAFDMLLTRYPRVMLNLLKIMVNRLRQTTRRTNQKTRPKTFAVIPLQQGIQDIAVTMALVDTLTKMGAKAAILDYRVHEETTDWFNRFEAEHDVIFYQGDAPDSAWTHFCLRQSDRVLLLAHADKTIPLHPFERRFFKRDMGAQPELLLVHPSGSSAALPSHIELRSDLFESHHHMRAGEALDVKRLARFIAGSAVNVVLAGGGARGFAHIGVLKALQESGVPFDYVAGTSMGGIVAAGLALEWSIEEITERVRDAFVDNNPLSDFTLPLIALFRGARVSALLRKHFGDVRIEDLPKPYFCVSADLTSGRDHVHRSGLLWRALRASVALPGILPPVTAEGGHLLVDGGVMNNLPVDVMAREARGPIIAVDVSGEIDLRAFDGKYGERSIWSLATQRMRGSPSIISILMRAGTVGSDAQRRIVREQADFLFEPPLEGVGMRDWKAFERAIAQGYAHAMLQIEKNGVPLSDSWAAGPALAIHRTP
ncbi:MAG: family protein RssA [Pseudomonadota bacterium]|jgi:NTE family protein